MKKSIARFLLLAFAVVPLVLSASLAAIVPAPKDVVGMSWRNSAANGAGGDFISASDAAAKGHDMVLTPSKYCYFSRRQGLALDPYPYYEPEPYAEQKPRDLAKELTLENAYSFDPYAPLCDRQ